MAGDETAVREPVDGASYVVSGTTSVRHGGKEYTGKLTWSAARLRRASAVPQNASQNALYASLKTSQISRELA